MTAKELYELLAGQNRRVFAVSIDTSMTVLMHHNKTTEDWRADMRRFLSEIDTSAPNVTNQLFEKLSEAGYVEVLDVISDIYEGRTVIHSASIQDDPEHAHQATGFGHYGFESKDKNRWFYDMLERLGVTEEDCKKHLEEKPKDK